MTIRTVAILLCMAAPALGQSPAENEYTLIVADGQLKSHPIRVFIPHDIRSDMNPRFSLVNATSPDGTPWTARPRLVARHQTRTETIDGQAVQLSGTMFLFDCSEYKIPFYKAMTRIAPTLAWEEQEGKGPEDQIATTSQPIYLGNTVGASLWTSATLVFLILLLAFWSRKAHGNLLCLLVATDGKLSLSRVQIAAWTLAIGSLTFMFGLIRLDVPDLPESLLALMGLSLATGGISYAWSESKDDNKAIAEYQARKTKPSFSDLITESGLKTPSIARAQMVVWTVLLLILFVFKSLIDGVLWEVPWELVALMGFSQAGYLAPKLPTRVAEQ